MIKKVRSKMRFRTAASLLMVTTLSSAVVAKEYNSTTGIAPEQRVKIDKTIAKSNNVNNSSGNDTEAGAIVSEGVANTDCGEVSIGDVEVPQRFGSKRIEVDRDIIILGDIINVATDCNRRIKSRSNTNN